MQLNVNDYASMTGQKPAPLYSNNVLLVCGDGEAWEYYKNVIVFVGRTATDFGRHLIANSKVPVFPWVSDTPRYRF